MYKYNFTSSLGRVLSLLILLTALSTGIMGQNNQQNDSLKTSVDQSKEQSRFTEINTEEENKLFSMLIFGHGGMFEWQHSNSAVTIDPSIVYGGGLAFNFRVVDWLEISAGAGISVQTTDANVQNYSVTMMAVDNEGDPYEKRISASGVEESQQYLWVEFPLLVRYFYTAGNWDFFAEAGAEYRMPVKSTYDQSGIFSHQGYYKQYDLLIDDLMSSGYYTDLSKSHEEEDIEMNNLLMPFVGLGVVFPGKKSHFFFEARYYLPGEDPFKEKQDVLFPGPDYNGSPSFYNNPSVMSNGEVSLSGIKGIVGIRF